MTTQPIPRTDLAYYFQTGTHAARPAAPTPAPGAILIYYETDTLTFFHWDPSTATWITP